MNNVTKILCPSLLYIFLFRPMFRVLNFWIKYHYLCFLNYCFLLLNLFNYDYFKIGQAVTFYVEMGLGCFVHVLFCHIALVFGQLEFE